MSPKSPSKRFPGCTKGASLTWIAMGLHPSDGNVYADGWYSGRIAAFYENNGHDTKKEAEARSRD